MDYKEFDNAESFEHLFMAEPENAKSTVQFDAEEYEEHQENPNQETSKEFPKSDIKQYFTFDDVPPLKWQSLGNEAYRALEARNVTIAQTTRGELYQLILNALAKLYNQKKFLTEFERTGKRVGTACDDRYLQIKCKDKSSCDCTSTKKKFHSKRFSSLSGKPRFSRQNNKKWKFIRKKKKRVAKHLTEPVDVSNLESLYSLDDEPSDSILCTIAYSDLSSDDDSDTDSLEGDSDFGVHMINPIPHVLPIQKEPPLPLAKIHLLTDAYAKPILVIAFFDTGSSVSILNPNILPDHYWKPHHQNFMAANGEKFVIDKISVPINIWLFPKCVIKRWLLGSSSHGKDLLIGFDILHKLPNLCWTGEGLHYRSFFNPWTAMHRLFVASITPPIFNINNIKQRLIQTCCASSHTEFLTKHPSPLWLNPSFFVSLPFKKNEDVNPTKASHPRMNPDHYQLAKEECEQLVSQGITEPTTSPWACEAFYVNKRSEQLDIKPEDRPKTAFCIPDHHYQWKVMPFGLKNAPLAFQKAMITIFEPILANTLVYIDDILLFSPDEQSHAELLSKFYSLVTKYGIMLTEKKMEVGVTTIQFLGIEISDGKYQPQPHVAQELLKFPNELSSQKRIQQFLGWSNWFSQWKFTVKHIKGTENVLADFLSRPKAYKLEENYPKDASRVQNHTPYFRSMVFSITSQKKGSSSNTTQTVLVFDLPEEIVETIRDLTFEKRAKLCYKTFLTILLKNHGLCIKGLRFNPDYPFLNIFHIHDLWRFPKEALCFFYYLFESFTIGITFNAEKLLSYVVKSQFKDVPPILNIYLLCYDETSIDDDDARSLWSSDDEEHFDPFEDDPTHPDAHWSP
nr:putative reverse transcriptase domain, viral movement protein [Tanacetum cinerariifolium]